MARRRKSHRRVPLTPCAHGEAGSNRCSRVVYESARALGLQNGVFGFQLTLDPSAGCTFLELNTRPHM